MKLLLIFSILLSLNLHAQEDGDQQPTGPIDQQALQSEQEAQMQDEQALKDQQSDELAAEAAAAEAAPAE